MNKTLLVLVFLLGGILAQGSAWSAQALSWEDCVREARAANPELLSAQAKLEQAVASKDITRSTRLPQVSAAAGHSISKAEGRDSAKSSSYSVSGRQLLFDGSKAANDLAAAREDIKSAAYDQQVVSSNVLLQLRTAFTGLLAAQELMGVTKDIVSRRQQNMDLVTLRYEGGREHKGALLTAQANLAQAAFEYEQALRNLELYQRRLSKELGRTTFVPVTVSGTLEVAPVDQAKPAFEALVDDTPLLKQLAARKEAARLGVKSAKADIFPKIYADAGAGKSGSSWPPSTHDWSAGISVSFPLFEGGEKQASLARARAAYEQLKADEKSGRDGVIYTLAETWTSWQDAAARVAVQEKFLEASALRSTIAEGEYGMGLITFNDWTLIEDALVNHQKAVLQAKMNALTAEAGWLQAKGETLDE